MASDDILEFLSSIQESLDSLSTKVASIETILNKKLPVLEAALLGPNVVNRSLSGANNDDDEEEFELTEPINKQQGPTSGPTMKASLARIELKLAEFEPEIKKLDSIKTKADRITQLELDVAKVDGRVRDANETLKDVKKINDGIDSKVDVIAGGLTDLSSNAAMKTDLVPLQTTLGNIQTAVHACAKVTELANVKTKVESIEKKVDDTAQTAIVNSHFNDIKSTLARVEGKVASAGLTSQQASTLGRLETKMDEAKTRDLAIYHNTVMRSLNGNSPKNAEVHMVLLDVHTGKYIYGNNRKTVDTYSLSQIDDQLQRLGAIPNNGHESISSRKSIYWGYMRNDVTWSF